MEPLPHIPSITLHATSKLGDSLEAANIIFSLFPVDEFEWEET